MRTFQISVAASPNNECHCVLKLNAERSIEDEMFRSVEVSKTCSVMEGMGV